MRKSRKTTFTERVTIVQYCLMNQRDYGKAAIKYQVAYHQVRNWVMKYEEMGEKGLEDRRGHRVGTVESRTPEEVGVGLVRHLFDYQAIKELHETKGYPIQPMCTFLQVSRSAYYHWLKHSKSANVVFNEQLSDLIRYIYEADDDKGYRRIRDELVREFDLRVNDKRIRRICRVLHIQSTIKQSANSITKRSRCPYHIAKNYLNRQFHAEKPNQKWVTDITEFKYSIGSESRKVYLSAILDLADHRIVSSVISDRNDTQLVFETVDQALLSEPTAHPLFHSDRGFQYTSKQFCKKLKKAGLKQSLSRVAHCTDNGPMEGFWGMLKREKYYRRKFTSRENLVMMINHYIHYYNNARYQRCLKIQTPMQCHQELLKSA